MSNVVAAAYSLTGSLDPTVLSLADLAAGHLATAILVVDLQDVVESVTATVTLNSSACTTTTTTTTEATTTTTTTETATTTTADAAAALEVVPSFTG